MVTVVNPDGTTIVVGPTNTATPAPATPAPANPQPATPAPAGNNTGQQGGVVIIHPNNPTPTAPVAGPTFVAQQTVDGGNRYFPNWVIWVIVFILLLLLAFGGYILYQSGKDAAPAKTETPVVTIVNPGGSKNAVDPKAREMAQEAKNGVEVNSQRINNLEEEQMRQQQMAEEKNKKDDKSSDCEVGSLLTF